MAAPTLALKAAGAALLSAESLAGALLPVLLARHPTPLSLISCFSGGVFLAAALLHLLPHCAEQHQALIASAALSSSSSSGHAHHHHHDHDHDHHHHHHRDHHGSSSSPPPPYLAIVLIGYLLVLAAERVLFEGAHDHGHGHGGHHHGDKHDHHDDHHDHAKKGHEQEEEKEEEQEGSVGRGRSRSVARTTATATPATAARRRGAAAAAGAVSPARARSASRGRQQAVTATTPPASRRKQAAPKARRGPASPAAAGAAARPPHQHPQKSGGLTPAGLRSCLVAVLATSVHTLLECAALGLASERRGFFALLAAVAAHKPASALALSSRFLRVGATPRQAGAYVSLFALVAPIGVAAGALAVGVGATAELWLSCLSCGAFLYVGLTEVIAEDLDGGGGWRTRWSKFGALLLGVLSVAAIGGHGHDHAH